MKRKSFLRISTLSFAGLLFDRLTSSAAPENNTAAIKPSSPNVFPRRMNSPREIQLQIEGQWLKLSSSNDKIYNYQDAQVILGQNPDVLSANLISPTLKIEGVRMIWSHQAGKETRCLGDRWERTYGDAGWYPSDRIEPVAWYILFSDLETTACFGVKTGCHCFCRWIAEPDNLILDMDTRSAGVGIGLGNRTLHMADIITTKNEPSESPFRTLHRFCGLMCDKPRLSKKPVYGINDWYYAYGNNNPKLILEQTKLMSDLAPDPANRPFSVIDAGWASYSPLLPGDCCWQDDFSRPNEKFKDMHLLADQIKQAGMRPGLWTRPLCAKHDDPASLLLPPIPGRTDPKNPVLDPSLPATIERIQENFTAYRNWGFELIKHDFSTFDITGRWGFQMTGGIMPAGWRFHDDSRTTLEVIKSLYQAIRDAAGDMYLIGCDTISHVSAGLFELNRIGDDTSGKEWARTLKMGVNTLGFRIVQHGKFYSTDADCVGLTGAVPWEKNKQWMELLARSGTPLFISAEPQALGIEQKAWIRTSFQQAARPRTIAEPLDWMQDMRPARWKFEDGIQTFNWA